MLPCPCGAARTRTYFASTLLQKWYYCSKCGFHGNRDAKSTRDAKLNWNKAVKEYTHDTD